MTGYTYAVDAGKGTVECKCGRRPFQSITIVGFMTVCTCGTRVVYAIHMAETAGNRPCPDGVLACRKISTYCGIVAGNTEIAAAGGRNNDKVESGCVHRATPDLTGMPAGIRAYMALGAHDPFGFVT